MGVVDGGVCLCETLGSLAGVGRSVDVLKNRHDGSKEARDEGRSTVVRFGSRCAAIDSVKAWLLSFGCCTVSSPSSIAPPVCLIRH